ncbi:hypothetical protein [Nisaea sp.]|uniref:hypothetical protein n=1 Tax=Nisaea sp. TaxID=2024842 RepID=UPI003B516F32
MKHCSRLGFLCGSFVLIASLSGCSTIDWMQTGRNAAAALCEGMGNCQNVCPDGSETDARLPRCEYRAAAR